MFRFQIEVREIYVPSHLFQLKFKKSQNLTKKTQKFPKIKLNFQKLNIKIPVEIPVNFMILTGTGIPANRLILTGTGISPGSRSILAGTPQISIINVIHYNLRQNSQILELSKSEISSFDPL